MSTTILPVAKVKALKSLGLNEDWLQERIFEDPTILGLGDLVGVKREKRQKSGGRLDVLLKNPTDSAMFEVEVMLGETDETHIIRTIEYWDFERRQYPQRQHFAVLVAESVTRRFFNVIQLLSASIPIIAIQANVVETDGKPHLVFTKILDVYSEPEDETEEAGEPVNEKWWSKKAPWVLKQAKTFLKQFEEDIPGAELIYVQSYVAIRVDGKNLFWFSKKANPNAYFGFKYLKDDPSGIMPVLEDKGINYHITGRDFYITSTDDKIKAQKELYSQLVAAAKAAKGS